MQNAKGQSTIYYLKLFFTVCDMVPKSARFVGEWMDQNDIVTAAQTEGYFSTLYRTGGVCRRNLIPTTQVRVCSRDGESQNLGRFSPGIDGNLRV